MSAAILAAVRARSPLLHVVKHDSDAFDGFWRSELTGELLDCDSLPYARTLRRMLDLLVSGAVVLPLRCRTCGRYFDQPAVGRWRSYCTDACRKDFPRRKLNAS